MVPYSANTTTTLPYGIVVVYRIFRNGVEVFDHGISNVTWEQVRIPRPRPRLLPSMFDKLPGERHFHGGGCSHSKPPVTLALAKLDRIELPPRKFARRFLWLARAQGARREKKPGRRRLRAWERAT